MANSSNAVQTPYSTALPFFVTDIPTWLDEYNGQRLASYDTYDDMYDNMPDANLLLRDTEDKPVQVPTGKRVINTLARYVGRNWGYKIDPTIGTDTDQTALKEWMSDFFKREELDVRFEASLPKWLRRGDWIWGLFADDLKPAGSKITMKTIDPRTYFPVYESDVVEGGDPDVVVAQQIIEQILAPDGKTTILKVQRWLKYTHPDHPNYESLPGDEGFDIAYDVTTYKLANFSDPSKRAQLSTLKPTELIQGIKALPLYHIKNNASSEDPFGESEFKGLETVITGINQTITDEDLALAIAGLGMYVTDSGQPQDETGRDAPWYIGPLRVQEIAQGRKFERLEGIRSVDPSQKHIDYLEEHAYGTSGVNDIALGKSDVQLSGVAMAIKMSPLFDNAARKNKAIDSKMTQLLHDLVVYWAPAFEDVSFGDCVPESSTEQPALPIDPDAYMTNLLALYEAGVVPIEYVQKELNDKFGFTLQASDATAAATQAATRAAAADPYGARATQELTQGEDQAVNDGSAAS